MAKKKGGDYEGWLLRLIDKIEDIGFSFSLDKWLKFAESKILGQYKTAEKKLTDSQKDTLSELRDKVWEIAPTKLNVRPEYVTRYRGVSTGRVARKVAIGYRDAQGRFTRGTPEVRATARPVTAYRDSKTGRFTKVVAEQTTVYRNLGGYGQKAGTTVSASKINAEITKSKQNKTWLKGEL